ncbi:hypothetical protein CC1G_04987 [Coprinopsis cinerea okayama7|uniref:Cytochrome c oxidase assembly protein COX20, mitochondrial n=1 Tax=Coprinopsis cinerea (strain Okayama-7 / 130 / ATCC MYA-4618 / FGSC 9003) TaxID=240176 RepID=A8NSE6_COPC7|nr:hypothetical protein CC1G_04987 [Coprinopsis cinerea okayama7\|eukprot:XP_001835994.2 hypothetical protein CC1G_04987 [Coprinopsis cinerea okayama7\
MASPNPDQQQPSAIPPPPSRLPPPTGNLVYDSFQSARHVTELPCARNSLLYGIAGGVGIGVVRGLSAPPMVAGHWAVGTFALISLGSWHLCQKQFRDERRRIEQIIESMPPRKVKQDGAGEAGTGSTSTSSA